MERRKWIYAIGVIPVFDPGSRRFPRIGRRKKAPAAQRTVGEFFLVCHSLGKQAAQTVGAGVFSGIGLWIVIIRVAATRIPNF